MTAWFVYARPDCSVVSHAAKELNDLTTQQLSPVLSVPDTNVLWIATPIFKQPLSADSKPLHEHPDLIKATKSVQFSRPETYLFSRPEADSTILSIAVTPRPCGHSIPKFFVDFDMNDFSGKMAAYVISRIRASLVHDCDSLELYIGAEAVAEDSDARQVIFSAKRTGFEIAIRLSASAVKRIQHRVQIVDEIIQTEGRYVHDLETIRGVWEQRIRSKNLMKPDDCTVVFRDIQAVHMAQTRFLEGLREAGRMGYSAAVGALFLEHGPMFRFAQSYVSNYPSVDKLLHRYLSKSDFSKELEMISQETDGRDLQSFLITPVQRMPRYLLFLRDLIKYTPGSHPDYEYLIPAQTHIESMTRRFDEATAQMTSQVLLATLQQNITNKFVFRDVPHTLLFSAAITFTQTGKPVKGTIYLFHNLIMLVKQTFGVKVKVVYDSEVEVFSFKSQWPTIRSYNIDYSKRTAYHKPQAKMDATFQFDEETAESTFFTQLEKLQTRLMLESQSKYAIRWVSPRLEKVFIPLVKPTSAAIGHHYFVMKNGSPCELYQFQGGTMTSITALRPVIKSPSILSAFSTLYLISAGNLYRINPTLSDAVEQVSVRGVIPSRFHMSIVQFERRLILFGGKSASGSKQYFDDLIIIHLAGNVVEVLTDLTNAPPARWCHSAIVVGRMMYVYGGSSADRIFGDLWGFDIDRHLWRLISDGLPPRKRHSCLHLGSFLGIIGGKSRDDSTSVVIVEPSSGSVQRVSEFGNLSNLHYSTAVGAVDCIYVFSGTRNQRAAYGTVFVLQVPESLRPEHSGQTEVVGSASDASIFMKRSHDQRPIRPSTIGPLAVPAFQASEEPPLICSPTDRSYPFSEHDREREREDHDEASEANPLVAAAVPKDEQAKLAQTGADGHPPAAQREEEEETPAPPPPPAQPIAEVQKEEEEEKQAPPGAPIQPTPEHASERPPAHPSPAADDQEEEEEEEEKPVPSPPPAQPIAEAQKEEEEEKQAPPGAPTQSTPERASERPPARPPPAEEQEREEEEERLVSRRVSPTTPQVHSEPPSTRPAPATPQTPSAPPPKPTVSLPARPSTAAATVPPQKQPAAAPPPGTKTQKPTVSTASPKAAAVAPPAHENAALSTPAPPNPTASAAPGKAAALEKPTVSFPAQPPTPAPAGDGIPTYTWTGSPSSDHSMPGIGAMYNTAAAGPPPSWTQLGVPLVVMLVLVAVCIGLKYLLV